MVSLISHLPHYEALMDTFFAKDFPGQPFQLFDISHLIVIALLVLLNLSFILARRSSNDSTLRKAFRYSMAGLLLVNEILWQIWNATTGQWTIETMLPLHLCTVFVYLSAYMLVTKNEAIYRYAYFLGIGGALQAYLTPDLGMYSFPHFRFFQVFISHGLIISAAIYMTVVEGYRPHWRDIPRIFKGSIVYMLFVGLINWAIGSNYLFIAHKPLTASVLDMLPAWPWYILWIGAIAAVTFTILYLPFAAIDWSQKTTKRT